MTFPAPSPSAPDADGDSGGVLRSLVDAIRADTAEAARVHARLIRRRAEVMQIALDQVARSRSRASRERELPVRSVALEIAVATHAHDQTVQKELGDAYTMVTKFAATVDALAGGRVGARHAQAILDTGIVLDDDTTRAGWEQVVLARAERDSPGRVRAFGRELAESVHPVGMTERHARAAATRGVSVRDLADGMAELAVVLPATVAYGIRDRLRRQAAAIRAAEAAAAGAAEAAAEAGAAGTGVENPPAATGTGDGADSGDVAAVPSGDRSAGPAVVDERTLAQIGADVCADLLLTAAPSIDPTNDVDCPGGLGAIRGHVQITVPVLTLLGHLDAGATVDGHTPIDPETARRLAAHAPGWDRVLCDPVTGTVLDVDRYAPTAAQRRFLAARDRHCRAPGCRAPIARCQIDHNHEAQHGGATRVTNLCNFCVRHHTLKTETEWTVAQDPDGTLHFRSPLGQRFSEKPPPRVVFAPDPLPAAPPF